MLPSSRSPFGQALAQAVHGRVVRTAGDVTTTSTSLVDLTGATVTLVTGPRPVCVGCVITGKNDTDGAANGYNIMVDAALELGTFGTFFDVVGGEAAIQRNHSFTHQTAALSAGSHTIKMQWQVSAGTGTISAGTGVAFSYWAHEVR